MKDANFEELFGKVITKIYQTTIDEDNYNYDDKIVIHTSDGAIYEQYHNQQCGEEVTIEDIDGDLEDLVGFPLQQAEESSSNDTSGDYDSATWTFYKLATEKGYVTIRWHGSSNGYYSESANLYKIKDEYTIKEYRTIKLNKINKLN